MRKLDFTPKTDVEKIILAEPIESLPLSDDFLNELEHLEFDVI